MKNLIIRTLLGSLFLSIISCTLFGQNRSSKKAYRHVHVEEILQKSLDIEYLAERFEKDENGELLPLVILSNGFFTDNLELEFNGQPVYIIQYPQYGFDEKQPYLDVTKLKIKGKKSDFEFEYCGAKYSIELKKRKGRWKHRETSAKGNGNTYVHVEF